MRLLRKPITEDSKLPASRVRPAESPQVAAQRNTCPPSPAKIPCRAREGGLQTLSNFTKTIKFLRQTTKLFRKTIKLLRETPKRFPQIPELFWQTTSGLLQTTKPFERNSERSFAA